jgi:hypothetical protein
VGADLVPRSAVPHDTVADPRRHPLTPPFKAPPFTGETASGSRLSSPRRRGSANARGALGRRGPRDETFAAPEPVRRLTRRQGEGGRRTLEEHWAAAAHATRLLPPPSRCAASREDEAKRVGDRSRSIGPPRPTRRDFCRPRTGAPPHEKTRRRGSANASRASGRRGRSEETFATPWAGAPAKPDAREWDLSHAWRRTPHERGDFCRPLSRYVTGDLDPDL